MVKIDVSIQFIKFFFLNISKNRLYRFRFPNKYHEIIYCTRAPEQSISFRTIVNNKLILDGILTGFNVRTRTIKVKILLDLMKNSIK